MNGNYDERNFKRKKKEKRYARPAKPARRSIGKIDTHSKQINKDKSKAKIIKHLRILQSNGYHKNHEILTIDIPAEEDITKIMPIYLHNEIVDFYNFMSPRPDEVILRKDAVNVIRSIILKRYPRCKVEVFGSYSTAMYLPSSDTDMVLFGQWTTLPMCTLREDFIKAGVCDNNSFQILDTTRVPILKFNMKHSNLKIDISFNMINGLIAAQHIKTAVEDYEEIPYIMMIVKLFLKERDLNEVFTGGLSSYSLFFMIFTIIKKNPRKTTINLGVILMEFLELYGILFNYYYTALNVAGIRAFKKKDTYKNDMLRATLVIKDPFDNDNDIGKGTFNIINIRKAFGNGFLLLKETSLRPIGGSILGRILNLKSDDIKARIEEYHAMKR